ncbi:hypothetical protein B0J11DRAFT_510609 [Dendryphion nanum]|uniref:Uncharacterized protein n=1 Tax=Dendryphion nanum TaxID=256645 RepID=A0A9P9D9N4_9PLEO|nr:hypothetical protein B0J11DRAFT_510609 [Dendryphion nanum]
MPKKLIARSSASDFTCVPIGNKGIVTLGRETVVPGGRVTAGGRTVIPNGRDIPGGRVLWGGSNISLGSDFVLVDASGGGMDIPLDPDVVVMNKGGSGTKLLVEIIEVVVAVSVIIVAVGLDSACVTVSETILGGTELEILEETTSVRKRLECDNNGGTADEVTFELVPMVDRVMGGPVVIADDARLELVAISDRVSGNAELVIFNETIVVVVIGRVGLAENTVLVICAESRTVEENLTVSIELDKEEFDRDNVAVSCNDDSGCELIGLVRMPKLDDGNEDEDDEDGPKTGCKLDVENESEGV